MKRPLVLAIITVVGVAGGAAATYLFRSTPSTAAGTSIDPRTVSRAGIAAPMHGFAAVSESGFRLAYAPSTDPTHDQIRELFIKDGVLDRVARSLNQTLAMPRTIDIQMVDCGAPNAFYDPNGHRIIVCYELITYFIDTFRSRSKSEAELGQAAMGATFFAFFHELGHALIHELDLASTGREEDAADQVATLVLLEAGEQGVDMALAGARWFALLAEDGQHRTPFWDEHGLDGQRFFNVLCMVFGEKPDDRIGMVTGGALPEDRAKRCPGEYRKLDSAWQKLLAPHLRAGGAAVAEPAPAPAPEVATGASCAEVAARAREVIRGEAQPGIDAEIAAMDELDRATFAAQVEERLTTIAADIERRCTTEAWPADVRTCLARVGTTADAKVCTDG